MMAKKIKKQFPKIIDANSPYKDLIQTIPDVMYEVDEKGRFTFLSNAIKNFGYKPNELIGKHFSTIIYPSDINRISRKKVLPKYRGKITGDALSPKLFDERRTGKRMTKSLAMRVMLKKSKKGISPFRWVEVHSSGKWCKPAGKDTGDFCGSIGIMRDITNLKSAEESLKKERDDVRKYLDIAGVMLVALDRKGKITFINDRGCKILGWPQEYLLGKDWFNNFVLEGMRKSLRHLFNLLLQGKVARAGKGENAVINNLGQPRVISWQNTVIYDENKKIIGTFSSGEDITDARHAQVSIEMFHEMTQDILRNSPFGIMVINADGGIEYANPVMADITGDTYEQIMDTNIFKVPHHSGGDLADYLVNLFSRGESFLMSDVAMPAFYSGKAFAVNIYGMPLKESKKIKALLFFEDLSEIRRASEALKIKDKAMDSSINAIVMADLDGSINYVNTTFLKMWGYQSVKDILEKPLVEFSKDAVMVHKGLEQVLTAGSWVGELAAKRNDGTVFDAWMSANMVKDDAGNPAYIMASFIDISEKKKIEGQLLQSQKMETIGRLAGGVAHDFNNLLTAMMNYATLAKYRLKPEDQAQDDLEQIIKVAKRASNLTHQLLSFSRRQIISLKQINVNEFLANIDKMLRRLIPENIELIVSFASDQVHINADVGQMEQALVNLVVNSRDAMPQGGKLFVTLSCLSLKEKYISAHAEIEPGEYVVISVKDAGVGMSDDVKQHLFEPFFTTKAVGKGTGLGLPTVYGIARQHHGHVEVMSVLGVGTEIKMYIPRLKEIDSEKDALEDETVNSIKGSGVVFLVEDEPMVRDVTVKILQNLGYQVIEAANGAEALHISQTVSHIDILVTDMVMPQMSGRELADKFKVIYPQAKVLFVSGYTEDTAIVSSLDKNSAFLQKPFTDIALGRKIKDILGK